MNLSVWLALCTSAVLYLGLGVWYGRRVKGPGDILPLVGGKQARVANYREFSASTVAATISLATVVIAFYELVPSLGFWLLWTALTTAMGLLAFGVCAPRIWRKMSDYDYRPTLHAYLGHEFGSKRLAFVASLFTALGYLSAFAVEITVGARFIAGLMPTLPQLTTSIAIALVAFIYTGLGGFRVVVVTDRIQMFFIWLLIAATIGYYVLAVSGQGLPASLDRIPLSIRRPTWSNSLWPFVSGIAVMNLLTFLSNMGLWQRIAGSPRPDVVSRGIFSSVAGSGISWSLLVVTAVGAFMLVSPLSGENLLVTLLKTMQSSLAGKTATFFIVLGLYGAMLSTASTQLIAVSHTVYEDIVAPIRRIDVHARVDARSEAAWSRLILLVSAASAVAVVEVLRGFGFTVADLAFAVYGAALGLVPPVLLTLFGNEKVNRRLSSAATWAVALGFVACWATAAYGRLSADANLVFLSPIVSTAVSATVIFTAWAMQHVLGPPRMARSG